MSVPRSVYRRVPRRIPHSLGFSRYCLKFDPALSQYVDLGDVLDMGTVDFVLEAWFKTTSTGTWRSMIRKRRTGPNPGYELGIANNDQIYAFAHDGSNTAMVYDGVGGFNDGKWHHVIAVFDRDDVISLYLDGELMNTASMATVGNLDNDEILSVGSERGVDCFWDGCIDEVRIYRGRTMTLSEVRHNLLNYHNPVRDGLVLWLPMEEGEGTTVHDVSGHGNDGTIHGATWTRVKMWELRASIL